MSKSLYAQAISEATGQSNPAALALIEDLMRMHLTGLDHLTTGEFDQLARHAREDAQALRDLGLLPAICESFGLTVPEKI